MWFVSETHFKIIAVLGDRQNQCFFSDERGSFLKEKKMLKETFKTNSNGQISTRRHWKVEMFGWTGGKSGVEV